MSIWLVGSTLALGAPASGPVFRIAIVTLDGIHTTERAFAATLHDQGVRTRFVLVSATQRSQALSEQISKWHPDLVYTRGATATLAVTGRVESRRMATCADRVPVVFVAVDDPVGLGILPRLSARNRNITGVIHTAPLAAQLSAIHAYGSLHRIGYLRSPNEPGSDNIARALRTAGQREHFQVIVQPLSLKPNEQIAHARLSAAITDLRERGVDVLYLGADSSIGNLRTRATRAALDAHLPTFCATERGMRALDSHCLFGLVSSQVDVGRQAARQAIAILRDKQRASRIPIEYAAHFSLLLNLEVARTLEIYPALSLLRVAQFVDPDATPLSGYSDGN
ncbi:hypothetical protein PIN31115_04498 [Pandoraea iniqua]|uniref:ABC transporter substrate-binding protein n=1 Tax=Pandoraea iniqua TaxID=2508288 RepID=A0A5E4YHS3_9BURK|nr:ABC transporter substrate binding protein [Pandoraea iniqua]VVE48010.1 hypothetical protein PIN31115_04498 [Pandoraea iniqua]